ncbi:MAG TPA: hypothetical protein PLY87_26620 [Planctomycetaceae bacterium]|nr:hypothetical protein [Planctomycetaceae bacterium]HRA88684.1 hypothetical protein [Planctomycetaceae bacterium]
MPSRDGAIQPDALHVSPQIRKTEECSQEDEQEPRRDVGLLLRMVQMVSETCYDQR